MLVGSLALSAFQYEAIISGAQSGLSIVLFTILSIVVGEFINGWRVSTFDVPRHFRRVLYYETNDIQYLGFFDRKIEQSFLGEHSELDGYTFFEHRDETIPTLVRAEFNLDDEFDGAYNLYTLIQSHLSSKESPQTTRLRTIYIFSKNTQYALTAAIILLLAVAVGSQIGLVSIGNSRFLWILVLSFVSITILYMAMIAFKTVRPDKIYIDSLLSDYFVMLSNNGED